jgi:hypothetical protein
MRSLSLLRIVLFWCAQGVLDFPLAFRWRIASVFGSRKRAGGRFNILTLRVAPFAPESIHFLSFDISSIPLRIRCGSIDYFSFHLRAILVCRPSFTLDRALPAEAPAHGDDAHAKCPRSERGGHIDLSISIQTLIIVGRDV